MLPARLEIIPGDDVVPAVLAYVSTSTAITVTCLPQHGVARTLATAVELADRGYTVVPHLAARSIASREQLAQLLRRAATAGITEAFVVGGDAAQAAGPYPDGESLMRDIAELSGGSMAMGVGGYPEGHPAIGDEELLASLHTKAALASHLVTQMCFSVPAITGYLAGLRREGITLPVWAGVAGTVPRIRLLRLARKIGVGSSLKFISGKGELGAKLLSGSRYKPGAIITELQDSPTPLAGVHLYTFNSFDSLPSGAVAGLNQ